MAYHPVYVDGPLKGQDFPVENTWQSVQACESGSDPYFMAESEIKLVVYTLRRFCFSSNGKAVLLLIGVSGPGEPDVGVLAEMLLSEAAKKALL